MSGNHLRLQCIVSCVVLALLLGQTMAAETETPSTKAFTLLDAVDCALANYPAIRAALQQTAAARAGVGVAQTNYLPRTDLLWQENRATRNNVSGVLLPQSVIPSISGPVRDTNSYASVWGSAAGALFSWEPFDFGLRQAYVDAARAVAEQATAGVEVTRLDVAAAAAEAFLAVLAAQQNVRATQANVGRLEAFGRSVHALVNNQLRPGADASRADAELAAATNQLIQAEQTVEISRATLAEALGIAGTDVAVDAGSLLASPTASPASAPRFESHPLALAHAAALEAIRARERALERSYFPRLNVQAAFYGRGTGARPDGRLEGGTDGLQPDTANWASGLSVTFPVFDVFQIHARQQVEAANEAAEKERYEQTVQQLKAQYARARAVLEGAQRIVQNTPIQLKAAQEAEHQAQARYKVALGTITEVTEAQRLLAQAEVDDALARLGVWRAQLIAARVLGDLKPFLQQVTDAPTARGQ